MSRTYRNIARVVRPHGKQGEVVVQPLRGLPFLLEPGQEVALTPPALKRDRFCTVTSVSDDGRQWRVQFSGIDDLGAAEAVQGCWVLAHEEDVALDGFETAWDDLMGRSVIDGRYGDLGKVTGVIETPANDVLQVEGPYGEVLIPLIEQALDEIPDEGPLASHIMDGLIDPVMLERAGACRESGRHPEGGAAQ